MEGVGGGKIATGSSQRGEGSWQRFIRYAARLVKDRVLVGVTLVGVLMVAPSAWDPWGLQAFLFLKLLVLLLALLAGIWYLLREPVAFPRSRSVAISIVGFAVFLAAAAIASRAPAVAWLGSSSRQLGVLTWLVHGMVFLVGVNLGRSAGSLRSAATWLSAGLLVAAFFGALEVVGLEPFELNQVFVGRLQSVFGNPAILAAYVTLALPLATGAAIAGHNRWLTTAAAVAGAVMLVLAGTRGAWIAAALAAILVVGRVAFVKGPGRLALTVGAAAIAAVTAFTFATGRWSTVQRAFEGRLATWAVAADVIADNPLGVGAEGFATEFAEHVDEAFVLEYTRDFVTDRAHNGLLDVGLTAGLPGAFAYLVLIGGVIVCVWRTVRRLDDPLAAGLAMSVLTYLMQQQAFFQLAIIDGAFWLLTGLLVARAAPLATWRVAYPLRVLALVLVAMLISYSVLGVAADRLDRYALTAHPADATAQLTRAADLRPADAVHYLIAASILREVPDATLVSSGVELVERGLRWAPEDELLLTAKVNLLFQVHRLTGESQPLDEAAAVLAGILARDRTNGEVFLKLGTLAYYRRDFEQAEVNWLEAARLMPHQAAPRDNLEILRRELQP